MVGSVYSRAGTGYIYLEPRTLNEKNDEDDDDWPSLGQFRLAILGKNKLKVNLLTSGPNSKSNQLC